MKKVNMHYAGRPTEAINQSVPREEKPATLRSRILGGLGRLAIGAVNSLAPIPDHRHRSGNVADTMSFLDAKAPNGTTVDSQVDELLEVRFKPPIDGAPDDEGVIWFPAASMQPPHPELN